VGRGEERIEDNQPANTVIMSQILRKKNPAPGTQGGGDQQAIEKSLLAGKRLSIA
jgi:hypothetical protein